MSTKDETISDREILNDELREVDAEMIEAEPEDRATYRVARAILLFARLFAAPANRT